MKIKAIINQHSLILSFFVLVTVAGALTVAKRTEFGVEVVESNGDVIVTDVKPGSHTESAGIHVGDKLLRIGEVAVTNRSIANWMLKGIKHGPPVKFQIERDGSVMEISLFPERAFGVGFVLLNTILGVIFLVIGLMVWWSKERDQTVRSFFRLNTVAGIAILLYARENYFEPAFLHHAYTFIWLFTYCSIPPAFADFIIRFTSTGRRDDNRRWMFSILYIPMAIVFLMLAFTYYRAFDTLDPHVIARYDDLYNILFGSLLIIYVSISIIILVLKFLRPANRAERDRIQWLLICTFLGLSPFVFLLKLPMAFGMEPFVPLWASIGLMLVVPVGWGMSVASFRMLKLEWALSRTIIFLIAAALLVYLLLTASLIGIRYFEQKDVPSLVILFIIGIVLLYFAASGFIDKVRWAVDRVYYRDWFNYQQALSALGDELSTSISLPAVVSILTSRLVDILKIEQSLLFVRGEDNEWILPVQESRLSGDEIDAIRNELKTVEDNHHQATADSPKSVSTASELFKDRLLVPLCHAGELVGVLILGRKISGASFSIRDFALLNTLSTHAAAALANLSLIKKLMDNEKRAIAVDMAGGVAHEINNSLSPLMGHAQIIQMSLKKEEDREWVTKFDKPVKIIVDMCFRIRKIAQNLSKISEPLRLERSRESLNTVGKDAVELLSESAGRIKRFKLDDSTAKYALRLQFDAKLPTAMFDAQQISQVFVNLIINASDALETLGHGTLTIGTRFDKNQKAVIGFVEDDGPGIPQHLLDKVMQPYFTTKGKGKGTGLGLAIVRSIIEAHNGFLRVYSIENHGTRIEFFLPVEGSS